MKNSLTAGIGLCICALIFWFASLSSTPEQILEDRARRFVEIATAYAREKPEEVDMYWGPESLDRRDGSRASTVEELSAQARDLLLEMEEQPLAADPPREERLRLRTQQLHSLLGVAGLVQRPTYRDEMLRLYGISSVDTEEIELQSQLDALQELLPGRGTLAFRIAAYRNRMLVPADKRRAVFEAALAECRRRSERFWSLPANENIEIVWSRDTQAAWHTFSGQAHSRLLLNDLSLAFLDSAVEVACHEGYPGHHLQYALREASVSDYTLEDKLVLLRSPESVLLEAAANLASDLLFPAQERAEFERDILAEIAGISPPEAVQYLAIQKNLRELEAAIPPIIQAYYDGEIAFNTATFRLEREAVVSSPSALLKYVDQYGTYTAGYTIAETILRGHIERLPTDAARWNRLLEIVTNPTESAAELFTGASE